MAKKKARRGLPSIGGYEGLCSRFADLTGMKSTMPSSAWEMHVFDITMTILKYDEPELLKEIRAAVKKHYAERRLKIPEHVSEEGKTYRCPTCNKIK